MAILRLTVNPLVSANIFGTSQDVLQCPDEPRQQRGFSFRFFSTVMIFIFMA